MDEYIRASIRQAEGKCHPETGHYATLVLSGIESKEEAAEYKRALYRSALWLHRNAGLNCSMHADIKKQPNGTFNIEYRAIHKDFARAHVAKKYGPDQTKWPYSTNRFHPNYGA